MYHRTLLRLLRSISSILILTCLASVSNGQTTAFVDVSSDAGIDHQFEVYEGMFGGGICVFDLDKDGFEDLYLTSGMQEDRLYLNNGDGTFKNIYEGSGMELTRKYVTQGVVGADVNRDGWVDLFITTITEKDSAKQIPRAINLLFLNNGDMTFRDATEEYGLGQMNSFSTGANFGDINGDGYPDLYVGNYFRKYEGELTYINDATIVNASQTSEGYLLLNQNGKSFKNVYEDYGLDFKGYGFGGVFTDFDNDGDQDLLVNHDFGYKATPNYMLENQFPRNKFVDVAEELEMDLKINSMGMAVGDYNEDGFLDYYTTNIRYNKLMVNQGPGKPFDERAEELGLVFYTISWGANFADFDHDGDLDLFVANGDLNPNDTPMGDFYFENNGGKFDQKSHAKGLDDYGIGRGSVVFDIENDGDLDILVVNQKPVLTYPLTSVTHLYRNDSTQGNWIKIDLQGTEAELNGLGSRVEVVIGDKKMLREIDGGGSSHMSQNSTIAHFGLGSAETIDSIIVKWTGGEKQILLDQAVNQLLTVVEPERETESGLPYLAIGLLGAIGVFFLVRAKRKS